MSSASYRQVCLDTKGSECKICGGVEGIIVHHIDGNRENNAIDNLIPVCKSCHGKIHAGAEGYGEWFEQLAESAKIHAGGRVREQQRKTLYLPDSLVDEAELAFDALNLRWRQEGNDPLEKHPDFYEQLLRNALDELGDVQERDLDELADELDLTDGRGLD